MDKNTNFAKRDPRNVEFCSIIGVEDGEYNSFDFEDISNIFPLQCNFIIRSGPFDRLDLGKQVLTERGLLKMLIPSRMSLSCLSI